MGVRIKVVTLVDRVGAAGGGERFAHQIAASIDATRFESILCTTRPSEPAALLEARSAGVRVIELARRSRLSVAPWLRLAHFLRDERVDVLHSHKFGSNVWGSLLARAAGVPIFVAHEHSWAFSGDRLRLLLDRHLVAPRADAVVAVSAFDRRRIVELERVDPDRVVLQPNGIPRVRSASGGALRALVGVPATTPIMGIVARLSPEKRVDLFIDALAILLPRVGSLHAVVVGDGPHASTLRCRARELGLDRSVTFLGRRDDVLELAVGFDVAVLCSDREGCPLTLIEYMALARPIVATDAGGVVDLVRDEREGLIVDRDDAPALAAAVERLLTDRALAARLGAQASARQALEFDLDVVVRRVEALYVRLLDRRSVSLPLAPRVGDVHAH